MSLEIMNNASFHIKHSDCKKITRKRNERGIPKLKDCSEFILNEH